jgi:hypothetical protein
MPMKLSHVVVLLITTNTIATRMRDETIPCFMQGTWLNPQNIPTFEITSTGLVNLTNSGVRSLSYVYQIDNLGLIPNDALNQQFLHLNHSSASVDMLAFFSDGVCFNFEASGDPVVLRVAGLILRFCSLHFLSLCSPWCRWRLHAHHK